MKALRFAALLCFLSLGLGRAWGQTRTYVFINAKVEDGEQVSYYLAHTKDSELSNDNCQLLGITEFHPEMCRWRLDPDPYISSSEQARKIFATNTTANNIYINGSGAYLVANLVPITLNPNGYRGATNYLNEKLRHGSGNSSRYFYYDKNTGRWNLDANTTEETWRYDVTVGEETQIQLFEPTIVGPSMIYSSTQFEADPSLMQVSYVLYTFQNTCFSDPNIGGFLPTTQYHYWYNDTDHATAPIAAEGTPRVDGWELIGGDGYVSLGNNGLVIVNSLPESSIAFTLRLTMSDNSHTLSVDKEIILVGSASRTVTIDDRENHNWTYYNGTTVGDYNNNYQSILYSPDPRNVKITYRGGGVENGSAVAVSGLEYECQNTFVYYKTIEKKQFGYNGDYPYQVIANPFSKRPKLGNTYYGFDGWKVVSGGSHIDEYNDNDVIPLDAVVHFTGLDDGYTPNCTSAEIVFEATWIPAKVKRINNTDISSDYVYSETGGTYETNFLVINDKCFNHGITASSPVTIMQVEPDWSADYRNDLVPSSHSLYTFNQELVPDNGQMTKMEHLKWGYMGDIDFKGKNIYIGRGIIMPAPTTSAPFVYGCMVAATNLKQKIRIESGAYSKFFVLENQAHINDDGRLEIVLGCDYDRANQDNGKLLFYDQFKISGQGNTKLGEERVLITVKSGKHQTRFVGQSAYQSTNCFYISDNSNAEGSRLLTVEGGEMVHIAGGANLTNGTNLPVYRKKVDTHIRIRGGLIQGAVYGGAAFVVGHGSKSIVMTGGTVKGWVAGAANGYKSDENAGLTHGTSYVYVGGNARVDSDGDMVGVDESLGGNVYGAGSGNYNSSTGGQIRDGSNVVIADNAYVERGVYGGGARGEVYEESTANVFILGNCVIGGNYDSKYNVWGGVYGGAREKSGGAVNLYIDGGTVKQATYEDNEGGDVFGGSNNTGTIKGLTSIYMTGGLVEGNVYGGGHGGVIGDPSDAHTGTVMAENVTVSISGGTVQGNVYGGSEEGILEKDAFVNVVGGTVEGSVFAAGQGKYYPGIEYASYDNGKHLGLVKGNTFLTMSGGWVKNCIFGGGELSCVGLSTFTEENGEQPAEANANGTTTVTVTGGMVGESRSSSDIAADPTSCHVFGGGMGDPGVNFNTWTNVNNTVVVVSGGKVYGSVYGGGEEGHVLGNTNVTINNGADIGTYGYTGFDGNVFGGGRGLERDALTAGSIGGNTTVNINGGTMLGSVYGGGRSGSVGIYLTSASNGKYGLLQPGAGHGHVVLNITGGTIGNDYETGTELSGGNVFGGCKGLVEAPIETSLARKMAYAKQTNTTITGGIIKGSVYGGGEDGHIKERTYVTVSGGTIGTVGTSGVDGNVYGAGRGIDRYEDPVGSNNWYYSPTAGVVGISTTILVNGGLVKGSVFGGGRLSSVGRPGMLDAATADDIPADFGKTFVTINGNAVIGTGAPGAIGGNVYGSGKGIAGSPYSELATVKNTFVSVSGNAIIKGSVFGGGEDGHVYKLTTDELDEWNEIHSFTFDNDNYGNTEVIIHGCCKIGLEELDDPLKGNVYGGGRGLGHYSRTAGQVQGNTRVVVGGNEGDNVNVYQYVFGGGNQGLVSGTKVVNISDGCHIHMDVYGGSNLIPDDDTWFELHPGRKTVNIYGGKLNNVYGCSRSTIDGENPASNAPADVLARDKKVVAFVNVSSGEIYGSIHGAGHAGEVRGSVVVSIGKQAIYNNPFANENVDKDNFGLHADTKKLNITGSVFGGSDYFQSLSNGNTWDKHDISGYCHIFIDGEGYDSENYPSSTTTNTINISGQIYGSGTHCESAERGRHIVVRNYGTRINNATTGAFESANRNMTTIQRCDNLVIENSNFLLTGAKPIDGSSDDYYSIYKVDSCIYIANGTALGLGLNFEPTLTPAHIAHIDSVRQVRSIHLKEGASVYDNRFVSNILDDAHIGATSKWDWLGVKNNAVNEPRLYYVDGKTNTVIGGELGFSYENVFIFNDKSRMWVRYHEGNTQKYGELKGFFRMLSPFKPKGLESFAYARPKIMDALLPSADHYNMADGGFLSYKTEYNTYLAPGSGGYSNNFTNTEQYPYTNVIEVLRTDYIQDVLDYRMWVTAQPFDGKCWYVDGRGIGNGGWGKDIVGDGWGLYPDKPKLTVNGAEGVYSGTKTLDNETDVLFDYAGNKEPNLDESDIIFVVGPLKDINRTIGDVTYGMNLQPNYGLRLFRYPGGHLMSNNEYDAGNGMAPNESKSTYNGLGPNIAAGPGPNYSSMLDVENGHNLVLDNVLMDGLYGHTIIDQTYLKFKDHNYFDQDKVSKPMVVTGNEANLTIKGSTVSVLGVTTASGTELKRGYNNTDASATWYYDSDYSGTDAQGGAVYVHPNATMNVEGRIEIANNWQKRIINAVDHPITSNVYLPTFAKHINITNSLYENTHIGITSPIRNNKRTYYYNTFSPIAVALSDELANKVWKNENFRDDQKWFFKNGRSTAYYSTFIPHHPGSIDEAGTLTVDVPKTLFFGWTWVNVVRKAPQDFAYDRLNSSDDLAWLISVVNGYNGQAANDLYGESLIQTQPDGPAETDAIDLLKYVWVPIGVEKEGMKPFSGSYDGQGHLICNLSIEYIGDGDGKYDPINKYGLFGIVNGGNINRTFVVNGHIEPVGNANIGGLAGWIQKRESVIPSITNSEAAVEIVCPKASFENASGGLVGYLLEGHIHSSMAMPDFTINHSYPYIGGLVGRTGDPEGVSLVNPDNTTLSLKNCFANAKFTVASNVAATIGGIVCSNFGAAVVENCYIHLQEDNDQEDNDLGEMFGSLIFDNTSGRTAKNSYAFESEYNYPLVVQGHIQNPSTQDCGLYSPVATSDTYGYMYSDNTVTLGETTKPLFKQLNEWVGNSTTYAHWSRPTLAEINDDMPVLLLCDDNHHQGNFRSLGTYAGGPALQYGGPVRDGSQLSTMLGRAVNVFVYGDVTEDLASTTIKATKVSLFEDAAITKPGALGSYGRTYVGVTFDNTNRSALDFYGNTLARDWHMLASPLKNAPLGINYTDNVQHGYGENVEYGFYPAATKDGYFPSNTPRSNYDYFCWYEPAWQWINFKRNGNSHWHYDYPLDQPNTHAHIDYNSTYDNVTYPDSLNVNESVLVPGKGYMMSIKDDTYMQSHGQLNNADVTIKATARANTYGEQYIGHNLVGNPFQGYLDFEATGLGSYYVYDADHGGYITYPSGGSQGGDYAPRYVHPHQGFFIKTKTNDDEVVTFNPVWVKTRFEGYSTYRDTHLAYPLVNLYAEDANGRRDILVVEFERPDNGGGFKAKALRNGNHQMYARFEGEDYGAFFAKKGTERVTVCFKTDAETPKPYTLRWNLQNGDFHSLRLIDNLTGINYDMLEHDCYTFEASKYDYSTRFYIVFSCTDVDEHEEETENNFAFFDGSQWVVNGNGQLELVDLLGRVLQSVRVSGDQSRVGFSQYQNGIYLLRLRSGNMVKVQKIVLMQ